MTASHFQKAPTAVMLDNDAGTPLPIYQKLKQMILRQIETGAWPAHHKLPSEHEMVAQFGASRMTVNRAMRELTAEGALVRRQGVGTYVAERKGRSALFAVNNIADEIAARDHTYKSRVVLLDREPASAQQALALDLREGQHVFHSIIVHYENDVPVQYEDRHVHPGMAPDYLEQDFSAITPYVYLSKVAPLTTGEHVVEAVLASPQECEFLDIGPSEPCLLIRRRTWSGERAVSHVRLLHPGSRHHLVGKFST